MATSVKGKSSAQIGRKVRMTKDKVKKIIRRPSEGPKRDADHR